MLGLGSPSLGSVLAVVWIELRNCVRNVRDGQIFIFWSGFRPQHTGITWTHGIIVRNRISDGGTTSLREQRIVHVVFVVFPSLQQRQLALPKPF